VIGNIDSIPAVAVDGAPHFVAAVRPTASPSAEEPAIFVARKRQDGGVLLLGRSLVEVYALRHTVVAALFTAALPALALAFLMGGFFARRTSQRLNRIHDSIVKVMSGDLQARLPERGAPDEIGRVSRDVNVMLDEISRLVSQIKSVGDNIAHDLRTSIAIVRARLERAVADADDRASRVAANQALGELDKAIVTIAALLRMAEIEHMPRSEAFKPVDLAAICADLFDFYEPVGRAKSIAMTLEATTPVPTLGDCDLLREAFANLIDNAIKFTPAGGAVRVQAAIEEGKPVVRVYDDGMGVAPGDRVRIFDRFYRTGASGRIPGSGLGLSIAAAIANLHDFELTVDDNRPGSVFEMSPRATASCNAR